MKGTCQDHDPYRPSSTPTSTTGPQGADTLLSGSCCQEAANRGQEGSPELRHDVEIWFGSLGRTLYTLLLSILGGLSWHLVCLGLRDESWGWAATRPASRI